MWLFRVVKEGPFNGVKGVRLQFDLKSEFKLKKKKSQECGHNCLPTYFFFFKTPKIYYLSTFNRMHCGFTILSMAYEIKT